MKALQLLMLLLMVARLEADVPEVLAYQKISSPHHEVPNPVAGWNTYEGQLLFTNRYLIVYEPQILDAQGNVKSWGYIEVFDRLTFEKLGKIHPDETAGNWRWGTSLAISKDYLAVGSSGITETPGVDVYDLKTFGWLYHLKTPKRSSRNGYGQILEAVGERLIVHATATIFIHDLITGKLLGALPLITWNSGSSKSSRFVMYSDQPDEWGYSEPTHIVDLKRPTELLSIRDLPFLQSGDSELYAKRSGTLLSLMTSNSGVQMIHGYDLLARKHLFSVEDKRSNYFGAASWRERLFLPDPYASPNGRVVVRNSSTGKVTGIITPGAKSADKRFGTRVACVRDTLFVSSDKAWYAYNPTTLKLLYRVDDLGWNLERAEPVPITGSDRIGFVFNFPNYDGFLYNSYYYNPQVMLLDPWSHIFTHRLNLEDAIIMSGFSEPINFGRKLYAAGPDAVAVERPGSGGDYKIFSLSPSAGKIQQKRVASLSYASTPGYSFEVRTTGKNKLIQSVAFGSGKPVEVDIPYADFSSGMHFELVRNQQFRVTDGYEVPWQNFASLLDGGVSDVAVHGGLTVVSVPEYGSPKTSSGAIFVLDITQKKIVRVIQSPSPKIDDRFGSSMNLDGNRLAVTSKSGTYVYNVETGELLGEFPAAMTAALSGNILIRAYNESAYVNSQWVYQGRVTAYDLSTGKSLYTVPTGYVSNFTYDTTRVAVGATRMLLGLNVHDLSTGQQQFTLASPNPEKDDNFPSAIAADGEIAAVGASGQGAAYLFDLTTGQYLRTCRIHDRPAGFTNYFIRGSGLCLDATAGTLGWVVPDPTAAVESGIHLFDILTGEELAKIVSPTEEVTHFPFPLGSPTYTSIENIYRLADAVAIDGNHVVFLQNKYGEMSLGSLDASSLRQIPLIHETTPLVPKSYLEVSVETRRDTIYQIFAGPSAAQASDTGISFSGTGDIVTKRLPIPLNASQWVASFQLQWANFEAN